jgi:formyltetrahydrofolate hydrolase
VVGQLVRGEVALLAGGAGQDLVTRGMDRGPLLAQLVEQVGHGPTSSIPT